MVKKRSPGQRPKVLLDSIDLDVLCLLATAKQHKFIGLTITTMCETFFNYQHKTLKPHLDKLTKDKLIEKDETHKGNVKYYKITKKGYRCVELFDEEFNILDGFKKKILKKHKVKKTN